MTDTKTAVIDPATLEVVGHAPSHDSADVDRAVAAATAAFPQWADDTEARRSVLRGAASDLQHGDEVLGLLLSREQGKPLAEAVGEVHVAARLLAYYAELEFPESSELPPRRGRRIRVDRCPVGPVAAVVPWNFPLALLASKLGPALLAGCTVVTKPAETTPLSTQAFLDVVSRRTPTGVVGGVYGNAETSRQLTQHPAIRKVSFTGSEAVGAALVTQSAPSFKRLTLELGGNDPAIVLDDVDVESAAEQLAASAFRNAGQVCMAVKRVYAPRSLAENLAAALGSHVERHVVGHGVVPGTTMGPMHTAAQQHRVRDMFERAVADGGRVVTGGGPACRLPGHFMAPAVVADTPEDTPLVLEEQFGPVLPVVAYDDLATLLDVLGGDRFGLGASVWSQNLDRADAVARQVEAGTVWINDHSLMEVDAAFGGWKHSGLGRERGPWGLEAYLELRTVNAPSAADGGTAEDRRAP